MESGDLSSGATDTSLPTYRKAKTSRPTFRLVFTSLQQIFPFWFDQHCSLQHCSLQHRVSAPCAATSPHKNRVTQHPPSSFALINTDLWLSSVDRTEMMGANVSGPVTSMNRVRIVSSLLIRRYVFSLSHFDSKQH